MRTLLILDLNNEVGKIAGYMKSISRNLLLFYIQNQNIRKEIKNNFTFQQQSNQKNALEIYIDITPRGYKMAKKYHKKMLSVINIRAYKSNSHEDLPTLVTRAIIK